MAISHSLFFMPASYSCAFKIFVYRITLGIFNFLNRFYHDFLLCNGCLDKKLGRPGRAIVLPTPKRFGYSYWYLEP